MPASQSSFQFHKGTIKTTQDLQGVGPVDNFNSIKVRLKQGREYEHSIRPNTFQFHKGTIKTLGCSPPLNKRPSFQFHKGTIKTHFPLMVITVLLHFNSIKVRLKRGQKWGKTHNDSYFNSIKVRLKPLSLRHTPPKTL